MYDNVIGHSTDIDLMTLTSGKVDISGDLESLILKQEVLPWAQKQ